VGTYFSGPVGFQLLIQGLVVIASEEKPSSLTRAHLDKSVLCRVEILKLINNPERVTAEIRVLLERLGRVKD
jgi:hypothetical protein